MSDLDDDVRRFDQFDGPGQTWSYCDLRAVERSGLGSVERLPYSIRILLEGCLRHLDGETVTARHVEALAGFEDEDIGERAIPFQPGRIVLQDFTGVPAIVDLAALRSAMDRWGEDPSRVNPQIRADLVVDHSVQVDSYGGPESLRINTEKEFERNRERYQFLKWGRQAFDNFTVVPPETGIVHQVNLEYFASGAMREERAGRQLAYPDSLLGTDSHTTMINGLGVLGWGVGGIEAEACMLGEPMSMLVPEVVGFELDGTLPEGATATDLVLTVTQMLRDHGVVGKFVEFHGPGLDQLSVADRATIANMSPEYGATAGYFPVDEKTLEYLYLTGRSQEQVDFVESYFRANDLWRDDSQEIDYTESLSLDLNEIQPSLAGPKNPHERVVLGEMQGDFQLHLEKTFEREADPEGVPVEMEGESFELNHGDIAIAAITSCTNTSNPAVMVGAGLIARRARELGLEAKPWVKSSLAPGSRVVTEYLDEAGLTEDLEAVGFYNVGYGCTTCIGNSGPLPDPIVDAIDEGDLVAASILSGNRNFEGRVSPHTLANYLASPPLVVAYALAGTVDIDLYDDPIGTDEDGDEVYLEDLWPSNAEIHEVVTDCVDRDQYLEKYAEVEEGTEQWRALEAGGDDLYDWGDSTYIQEPPFFVGLDRKTPAIEPIEGARALVKCGDQTTTDHISPAGRIEPDSPAGRYLQEHGVEPADFNSYGSRRGNDQVMTRGTFANIRFDNELAPSKVGGYTTYFGPDETPDGPFPDLTYESPIDPEQGEVCRIYDAAVKYRKHGIPLVVLGGEDYGMGSSRDWAAKGTDLLGVEVVVATSYERIHRSNLIGMGVLPLQFREGEDADSLGLLGREVFDVAVDETLTPGESVSIEATDPETGETTAFEAINRIDTASELEYYRHGGILQMVLRSY
ncbi:MAG: aconitate hydratase AcnA [Bradymonadaceae bacterium]